MSGPDDFVAWAMASERTLEERCAIEKAVEWGNDLERYERGLASKYTWEQQRELHKARRLNPAYEPTLSADMVRNGAAGLRLRKEYSSHGYEDRPMRDLSWVRFFPHFEELSLTEMEAADYSPVAALPELRKLTIQDDQTIDLRPVGKCAALEELSVRVRQPWVKVEGLERLERLHTVRWSGSPLVLQGIPRLPAVRRAVFKDFCLDFPLRDAFQLPEMPWLEVLELQSIFSLEGMERYPRLINLKVAGPYRDVQPLTACRALTHLWLELSIHLELDMLRDVSPLAALPELRFLQVRSQRPRDYSVLVEAPRLHEVSLVTPLSRPLQVCAMEQATLNATLDPWDTEFLLPAPRPLPPLRVGYFDPRKKEQHPEPPPWMEPPPAWDHNPGFRESEGTWLQKRLAARLLKLLDDDEHWGDVLFSFGSIESPRSLGVTIASQEAAERLREVIELIRAELAHTRSPWQVALSIHLELPPVVDPRETAELQRLRDQADDEDRKLRQKEKAEFLERKHRLELQKEAGTKVRPEDFAAPGTAEPPEADEESGRTATDDLRELVELFEPDRPHPLAERYRLAGTIDESGAWFYAHFRQAAEFLLDGNPPP